MNFKFLPVIAVFGFFVSLAAAVDTKLETRVENILGQMTLEEKVAMCVGGGAMEFKGVPRLNLPNMACTDGPRGTHTGTAFPVGVAFGATWNPPLLEEASVVMGKECRAEGATMLLGSMLNIQRDPLGGRFFELYTEDPFLNAEIAVACVKGVQSQNVADCIKVMSCNNREENRNEYMSMVSLRALHEIYFPGFKAGVERGHAWAMMTSANGVNGEFASDSHFLLTETLKENWGFDGMTLTDWLGTRSMEKAAFAGLDVSMPYAAGSPFGKPLLAAVQSGKIPESVVDDKARRVLRTMGRVGLLDGVPPTQGGVRNTPEHYAVSRRVAEESLVLLKNEKQTLPLDLAKTRKLLVVGPNADQRFCLVGLGGSSWQESAYEITPLQGIRNAVGTNATVQYFSTDDLGGFEEIPAAVMREQNGNRGFLAKYFKEGDANPVVERVESEVKFLWEMKSPDTDKIPPEHFRAEFTGEIIPPVTGTYTLRLTAGGGAAWVFVDAVGGAPLAITDTGKGIPTATATVQMQAGKPFYLRVAYTKSTGDAACRLEWALPTDEKKMATTCAKLAEAAKAADAVLVFAGIDHSLDSEGRDRTDMNFPEAQTALIKHLAAANPKTIVTLLNGSPLELGGWLDKVPAVLEAWYPGMEGGTAIANALFGKINPSGKLPFSWPKQLADSPSHAIGRQSFARVEYLEDIFVGYRYFDTKNVEPQFPFGFGLSYTTFAYDGLAVKVDGDKVKVSFTVKNTGKVAGAEVAQVYVAPPIGNVGRPVHELKGFKKVFLKPFEKQTVEVELDRDAFAYFDEAANGWVVPPGHYGIEVGGCSRNLDTSGNLVNSSVTIQEGSITAAPIQSLKPIKNRNLAVGRPVEASSEIPNEQGFFPAQLAVDGLGDTRWSSKVLNDQWLAVDLGEGQTVSSVELLWEAAYAAKYVIEISADGAEWKEVARKLHGNGGVERLQFEPVTTRWIRMRALERATVYGVSLWEMRVTCDVATPPQDRPQEQAPGEAKHPNLASGRPVEASSEIPNEQGFFPAQLAVDGQSNTRWSSDVLEDQWLAVDLGENTTVSGVELVWETAYAAEYVIEISADGEQWQEVARNLNGSGGVERLQFEPVTTRWIRMRALKRGTIFGVSLWEFCVTGNAQP